MSKHTFLVPHVFPEQLTEQYERVRARFMAEYAAEPGEHPAIAIEHNLQAIAKVGRCETCEHWWADELSATTHEIPGGWRFCQRALANEEGKRDDSSQLAVPAGQVTIYGNKTASLATAPSFGCVQWEAKSE